MKSTTRGVAWFSSADAAAHLALPSVKAFHKMLERLPREKKPRCYRLGRLLRFRQVDLDALLEPVAEEKRQPFRIVGGRG